ncbi:hypothetical protein, variant 3 [Aphanomyces invadans]|uniref:RING-type domain-containing protein n=2 Tax=Aphanomyces invadans TaxID=157072 RepID=A0A024UIB7_9STRA|nr:hypothetical protein, variant 3 [Aphanomyces invadans]XP_008865812.1 hypothetical protein, variant 2 [Aphanomyces invadans]ETW06033.1 hypothetical protein, variant 2 [Aphanomyces invadans]ETW06034.1 hypothetical protein, variant 3 [Aphanomyces invadans]|eukprot:XP_008865811.1 hypothetical protein, variant 3 [Aphanomyces invadans]
MGNDIPDLPPPNDATFIDENDIVLSFADDEDDVRDSQDDGDRTVLRLLSTHLPRSPGPQLVDSRQTHGRSFELLSPEHQRWYASRDIPELPPQRTFFEPRGGAVKHRPRLRARSLPGQAPAAIPPSFSASEPEAEPTTSTVASSVGSMSSRLEASLARNLALTQQVKRLSWCAFCFSCILPFHACINHRDYEKLSVQLLQVHRQAEAHGHAVEREMERTRKLSRKLELVAERYRVTNEGYAVLKQNLNAMRVQLHAIGTEKQKLTGDGAYHVMAVPDLEALEKTLEFSLTKVRHALRQQYRDAVDGQRETCVVCLHEQVSIVLLPCRHRVLCASCAVRVQACPVDRVEITDMFPTFGM